MSTQDAPGGGVGRTGQFGGPRQKLIRTGRASGESEEAIQGLATEALGPPQSGSETDSAGLAMAQAQLGFWREVMAAVQGQDADPVLMAQYKRIIGQITDLFARGRAQVGGQQQQQQNMERQTGIPEPQGTAIGMPTRSPMETGSR